MSSGKQYKPTRIVNWKDYNQALVDRGSLTFWFPEDGWKNWFFRGEKHGRGNFKTYSDWAIQTCLTLKAVFHLPLRATEGFVNSLFKLMDIRLSSPDYSVFSKRARHLQVQITRRTVSGPMDVVFDSTGLKVYGEGEWKVRQHGIGKRRTWRKLHIAAAPETGDYVAVELTTVEVGDSPVLPDLLAQLGDQPIGRGYGDGAYDTREDYTVIAQHGGQAVIPPRDNAAYWEAGHPRNQAVAACRQEGRGAWKKAVGYYARTFAETMVYRYKQLMGDRLSARVPDNQGTEAYIGIAAINRMNTLGMPVRA